MSDQYLVGEKKDNIYTITLNRPDKRNAINVEMLTGICELVERQAGDPDIRPIILSGRREKCFPPECLIEMSFYRIQVKHTGREQGNWRKRSWHKY